MVRQSIYLYVCCVVTWWSALASVASSFLLVQQPQPQPQPRRSPWRQSSSSSTTTRSFLTSTTARNKPKSVLLRATEETESVVEDTNVSQSTTTTTTTTNQTGGFVAVRRYYETFEWEHGQDKTYKINYRVEGPTDGPPILLVHGFGANVNHFRYQFPALVEEGYRVYAVDLLGFGGSDKPKDEHFSVELFTELLQAFIKSMSVSYNDQKQSWVLAGNSIGGLCCLSTATKIPDKIRGIVFFNCAGGMSGFRYEDVPWFVQPILFFVQYVVLSPVFGGRFFENFKTRENVERILKTQGVYRDTTNVDEELLEILLGPSDDDGAKDVFLRVFGGPPGPTPEALLPLVECPMLALWGDQDPWTPHDTGAHPGSLFAKYNDKLELELLPGAGHCPHDECPDLVNSKMIDWMNRKL